jgi:uncharacterized repeat protein (TIGR02543 family)
MIRLNQRNISPTGGHMRRLRQLGAIAFALFMLIFLMSCSGKELTITGIAIDPSSMNESIDISEFDLNDLKLIVTYSDGSNKSISLSESMISSADLSKLSFMGTHEITISYQGFSLAVTIVLEDHATLNLISTYYEFIISAKLFSGTYQDWLMLITEEQTLHIMKAFLNDQNQVVIMLSNLEEYILGTMVKESFTVRFFDKNGTLINSVIVEQGGSVNPPTPPLVKSYLFIGWNQVTTNIQSDLNVYAYYEYVGLNPVESNPIDELILSIDRLRNAQFDVDIESIFKQTSATNIVKRSKSLISILTQATSNSMDDPFNQSDFIQHPLYTEMFYHQGMYTMADIIDGYHVVTTSLSTYANNAINNMTKGVKSITAMAKESAYWAVDHITVADAWIVTGNTRFLLHYDEVLDRVEYYLYQYAPDQKTHYYEKIFIFYNDKGEEVIERYFEYRYEEAYYDGYWGSISYYNSVAGRDFNYLQIWLNEDYKPSDNFVYRGINLNEEGVYEYYENDILMISGNNAWYEMMPMINHTKQSIEYQDYRPFTVYSPDGTSNVMTFSKPYSYYVVDLYIPAFNGVDAVLIEEGGMYQVQQDSQSIIQEILSKGLDLMPMRWEMDVHNPEILTGFKTAKGIFMADSIYDENGISINKVNLYISREGVYDYQLYHNYLGVIQLHIMAESVNHMFDKIKLFMENTGITYEYGDINSFLDELSIQYQLRHTSISTFHYLNPFMGGLEHRFKDYASYVETSRFIEDYISIHQSFEDMMQFYPSINYEDMPSWNQIGATTFIHIEDQLTGTTTLNELTLDTSQMEAILESTVLLREDAQYTLYYALLTNGRLIPIGQEEPQTYQRSRLTFEGNQQILLPIDLVIGEYQLVLFFGKLTEGKFIRVSNVIPVPLHAFETLEFVETDPEIEYTVLTEVLNEQGSLYIRVQSIDIYAPKVTIGDNPTIYQNDTFMIELWIESGKTVMDLLSMIKINDTYQPELTPIVDFVFKDDLPVLSSDMIIGDGWKIIIQDSSFNQTILILSFKYQYNVVFKIDDDIYHQVLVNEETLVDFPSEPSKEGYTFIGWHPDDLLITDYTVFQAIFEKNSYTITYYIDLVYYQEQVVNYDDIINYLIPTAREGYTFSGWDISFEYMPAQDLSAYATYIINQYTITFETYGGSYIESQTNDYMTDLVTPEVPIKEGFTFEGWYTDEALLIPFIFSKMPAEDVTVYAKWQPND